MTWFRVDDTLADHRKVRRLGRDRLPAMGLWVLAGSWVGLTDNEGFVPDEIVERYDQRHRLARRLVAVALWERVDGGEEQGYQFHDWHDMQLSLAEIEKKKAKNRERQRRFRQRRAGVDPDPDEAADESIEDAGNALHNANAADDNGVASDSDAFGPTSTKAEVIDSLPLLPAVSTGTFAARELTAAADREPSTSTDSNGDVSRNALHRALVTDPRPDPTRPITTYGDLAGGTPDATARDSNAASRATPHDPPCEKPCRRCQAARLATEEAEQAARDARTARLAEAAATRRACRLCDADGWTWHDPNAHRHGVTNTRCDHRPHLTAVQEATA